MPAGLEVDIVYEKATGSEVNHERSPGSTNAEVVVTVHLLPPAQVVVKKQDSSF